MIYGYIRVSTEEQNLGRQLEKMRSLGIPDENIFQDKASGKNMERADWQRLVAIIREGDLLVIDSLDRLGRNYDCIISEWKRITRDIKCDIQCLDLEFFDSRNFRQMGDVGVMIEDMLLTTLAYVADAERKKIVQRTREGVARAKAAGKMNGRPPTKFDPELLMQAQNALDSKGKGAAGRVLGVTRQTVYNMIEDGRLVCNG